MSVAATILWTYVAVLLLGGAMGYVKAGSKVSLITALVFGVLLALCCLGVFPMTVAWGLQGFLALFFLYRALKTKKFMPSGMMAIASGLALWAEVAFRHFTPR